jgi:hypothetical protein
LSWIKLRPFHNQEEASRHMVDLLLAESEILNTPLTEEEREILAGNGLISDELCSKAKYLIGHVLENERQEDSDPQSFGNSMLWASDGGSSNVVELTHQVVDGVKPFPRGKGWPWVRDRMALIGCGVLVVLLMFAAVTIAGLMFHWK